MLHCIFVRIYQRLMDNEIATYSMPISGDGENYRRLNPFIDITVYPVFVIDTCAVLL